MKSYPITVSLCLLFSFSALAQTAGFGVISGVVRDASGGIVPGASVTISNDSKGIRRELVTNGAGRFSAPALVPAAGYSVIVSLQAFATYRATGVDLQVGEEKSFDVTLRVAGTATEVLVTEAPLVDTTKTDASQVVGLTQIQELPINGRRVDSFVLLTPGVSNDGYFGNLTFRGMPGNSSFLVDGVDNTQQYFNENAGRSRIGAQISQDAVQEFQVVSSSFSAEYGKASGGVVNTVTRSGGNNVRGTAYWFFRNRTLNARDRYATVNPPEVRHQAGGSIGGPLKRDKLFYFLNFEAMRRNFPIASSINRPAVIDGTGHFIGCGTPVGGEVPTAAQCAAIDTILPRFFAVLPREHNQELTFAKLDYHPGARSTISANFNFLHFVAPNGIQSAIALNTGAAITSNGDASVRVRNGRVSWTGIPTNSMVNEFRFGWFTDRQADDFNPGVQTAGLGFLQLSVGGQAVGAGASYLPRINPNEQRFQFADNFSWIAGKHAFRFGVDIARTHDYVYNMANQFGSYSYNSVSAFALDFSDNPGGTRHWSSYNQTLGNPAVAFTTIDNGFYAQDQYRPSRNLTLNYGLRYDYAVLPQPTTINPDYPATGRIPSGRRNFQPRAGLAYSIGDKTIVRAGFGIYHQRYPGVLISSLFTNNAVYQQSLSLTTANYSVGPVFPNRLASSGLARNGTAVEFAAPNLRTPYTEQLTVALERELPARTSVTVSYLWNRGIQGFGVRDLNVGPFGPNVTYQIADANGAIAGSYTTPTYLVANRVDPRYSRVLQVENGVNSYYNAMVVQVRKQAAHGFEAGVTWTWSHEIDYKQGTYQDNYGFSTIDSFANTYSGNYKFDKGSGLLDQRHRATLTFIERPTFTRRGGAFYKYAVNNWQISGIITLASGRPTTPGITIQDTTPFPGAAFTSSLNGFGGSNRPPFWEPNPIYSPPVHRADLRLTKVLPLGERRRLYLNFEAFNVTNSPVDTSLNFTAFTERAGVLTPVSSFGTGRASAGFPDGTNVRRCQVSARFTF